MRTVALTGNIASGKSTVARIWARLGARIVDADLLARKVVEPGTRGLARVVQRFGPGIIRPDGGLDREALRRVVFSDPAARGDLESILHPAIAELRKEEEARLEAAGADIVVHVIPLLFEVGMQDEFDDVVFVDAPPAVRLRRLTGLRGLAESEARSMIDAQMPAEAKREAASLVIDNTGTIDTLERAATAAWREIEKRARSARRS